MASLQNLFKNCAIVLILCHIFALASIVENEVKDSPQIEIVNGKISGKWMEARNGRKYAAFEGIPYAFIPQRFAPPKPMSNWSGIKDVTSHGPVCPQFEPTLQKIIFEDENCLFANVYVPTDEFGKLSLKNLPVMIWIHGGGFLFGAGSFEGAEYILEEDIIFITINYRLGSFGFLSFGPDDEISGNMGLKDMLEMLKWNQKNIIHFGGNPQSTTIFGESAGATAVHALALSPASKGLFQKFILHSGSLLCPWAWNSDPLITAKRYAKLLNCTDEHSAWDSKQVAKCLRAKPTKDLVQADWAVSTQGPLFVLALSPTIDPKPTTSTDYSVLPDIPVNLIRNYHNNSAHLPFLIGYNQDEGLTFAISILHNEEMLTHLNNNWNDRIRNIFALHKITDDPHRINEVTKKIQKFYFDDSVVSEENEANFVNLFSDYYMIVGIKQAALLHAKRRKNQNVYPFILKYRGNFSLMQSLNYFSSGVTHADDLQYLFPSTMEPQNWPDLHKGSPDEEFSRNLIKTWTSFSKTGVPQSWGESWMPISTDVQDSHENIKWFSLKEKPTMDEMNSEVLERIKFWTDLLPENNTEYSDDDEDSWCTWLFYLSLAILPILLIVYMPNVRST